MRTERMIFLTGVVRPGGKVDVVTVARIEAVPAVDGRASNLTVQLLGAQEEVLAQAPLMRLTAHGMGCGCDDDDAGSYLSRPCCPTWKRGRRFVSRRRAKRSGCAMRQTSHHGSAG
jgi:hypothetical protein